VFINVLSQATYYVLCLIENARIKMKMSSWRLVYIFIGYFYQCLIIQRYTESSDVHIRMSQAFAELK